ncbi:MAG: SWIM zinc finger family protein [bacterium]
METIQFKVQGSASEPYATVFKRDGENLTAHCTCPAGEVGQYCKHRLRILSGETEGIVSGNERDVITVQSWLKGTDVETALNDVAQAERRFDEAKRELDKSKKKLARALMT